MIFKAILNIKSLIYSALGNCLTLNKPRRDFFIEIMILFLSIKDKINFYQLGRFGKFGEQRYRQQFEKQFNFLNFNKNITISHGSGRFAIAFDPSYISKSGKKTYGTDKFWSGVHGAAKFGLEIGGIAAIDINNKTAFHIEAIQTPRHEEIKQKSITLIEWYANLIVSRKDILEIISTFLVADAYFSKKPFIDKIKEETNFDVISRLRSDADLKYLYLGEKTGKKGRPKKYEGKIDLNNINQKYFTKINECEEYTDYQAIVYSKALKRNINLVVRKLHSDSKNKNLLFFSTDLKQEGSEIIEFYKNRFQIEFLYRDAKQHTGLNDCQARDEAKLNFHFNASLTAINIAKVLHWISIPKEQRGSFSMADVKTMYNNILMMKRFIDVFAVPAYKLKNIKNVKELINFGKIAA